MHKYKQSTAEISISNARYFLGAELHLAMKLAMTTGKISAMYCGNSKFCATTSTVQKQQQRQLTSGTHKILQMAPYLCIYKIFLNVIPKVS